MKKRKDDRAELLDWFLPIPCARHDGHNGFKWGVLAPLNMGKEEMKKLYIVVESVRNSFFQLSKHLPKFLQTHIVFVNEPVDSQDDVSQFWTALGFTGDWLEAACDLNPFFVNFILPFFVLMSRDAKRNVVFLVPVALIIFFTHWLDVLTMVLPGTMHDHGALGAIEIGMFLMFLGLFLMFTLRSLAKAPLMTKNHPMYDESVHLHT